MEQTKKYTNIQILSGNELLLDSEKMQECERLLIAFGKNKMLKITEYKSCEKQIRLLFSLDNVEICVRNQNVMIVNCREMCRVLNDSLAPAPGKLILNEYVSGDIGSSVLLLLILFGCLLSCLFCQHVSLFFADSFPVLPWLSFWLSSSLCLSLSL